MPKFIINKDTNAQKTIEASHYKTDADWVRFFATDGEGNIRECASFPRTAVFSVEQEGVVSE